MANVLAGGLASKGLVHPCRRGTPQRYGWPSWRECGSGGVDEHERTQRGAVLGAIGGLEVLQKERLDFGFLGSLAEARRSSEQKESTRATITVSIQISEYDGRMVSQSWRSVRAGSMLRTRAPGWYLAIAATVSKENGGTCGCAGRPGVGADAKGGGVG